ncbi:MAG TPA: prenyltransferase/squalene oxidase repeat-containing protein [Ktedonobacteraceae bacterium]|nr:prenyltransferase/squalene oxidase repeat-containing protein [Ktedonobacteraceae bacterium]
MHLDLDQAIAFVMEYGSPVDLARLKYLLAREVPGRETIEMLFAGQLPEGGWAPFWAADYSSLDATCFHLAQADQMGLTAREISIQRAIDFLVHRQRSDGSWQEEGARLAEAPLWVKCGNEAATLYLTANCGFWVALLLTGRGPASIQASQFLHARLLSDGSLPSFLHANWLAAGLWYRLGEYATAELVLIYLSQRLEGDAFATSNLSWLITSLCAVGVPITHPLINRAAGLLAERQNANGCWPSEDGPDWNVHTTLEALRALRICQKL